MALKLNDGDNYEPITIKLDKVNTPIAYRNKIEELVEQGVYADAELAEFHNPTFELECEIYYEKHSGAFAVECGAVESNCVYSPYSGEQCEYPDDTILDVKEFAATVLNMDKSDSLK